jgi:hypothetical protein
MYKSRRHSKMEAEELWESYQIYKVEYISEKLNYTQKESCGSLKSA